MTGAGLAAVSIAVFAIACSSKDNPGPDCPEITTTITVSYMGSSNPNSPDPNSIYGITHIYCQGCHGSTVNDRRGAPLEIMFDTYEQTVQWGLASDEQMASNQMPPPPAVLSQSIICAFDNWVVQNFPP